MHNENSNWAKETFSGVYYVNQKRGVTNVVAKKQHRKYEWGKIFGYMILFALVVGGLYNAVMTYRMMSANEDKREPLTEGSGNYYPAKGDSPPRQRSSQPSGEEPKIDPWTGYRIE